MSEPRWRAKNMPTKITALTATLAIIAMVAAITASSARARAADDWEAVPDSSPANAAASAPAINRSVRSLPRHAAPASSADAVNAADVINACGERALPPSPKIQGIVSEINGAWGSSVRVYQSVAPKGPHAIAGGCVFYNPAALAVLLGLRLDLRDPNVLTPMLYAIFAHEVGHEVHHDFAPSRAAVPNQIKELEADRFAGYTMKRLEVPATGLAPYWSMTGDEFGIGASHGTSEQRVAAFKEGWHEAEWNRAENSMSVTTATEESIAPEDSSAAP